MGKPANLTQKAVLAEQLQQIHENNLKKQSEELQRRQEELQGCLTLANDIERDERERKIEFINKRKDFLKEIENLK